MDTGKGNPICFACGWQMAYDRQYQSYYCDYCNNWKEPACKDPNCKYCKDRPEKPNE